MRASPLCRRSLAAVAALLALLLMGPPGASAGAFVESATLRSDALNAPILSASRLRLQNVAGDGEVDLLAVQRRAGGASELGFWERRPLGNGDAYVLGSDLTLPALDAVGLYVPGGIPGASRDLAVLLPSGERNLRILRNRGPGTRPRFAGLLGVSVPDAQRLHYFPFFSFPPGDPRYIAYPLIASTGDERLWLLLVGDDGSVTRQAEALRHPGGAAEVLVFLEPGSRRPAFLSLGAFPPLLWRQANDGGYASQPLTLPGLVAGDRVVKGVFAQFQDDPHPDLVLALADGRVLRWDGAGPLDPGQPLSFASAQLVATGLTVHELVELGVPYRDAMQVPRRRAGILIAAEPESRFYDTDPALPAFPFQPTPQRYAPARGAGGDFSLETAFLARRDGGVLVLQYDESAPPVPNRIGWDSQDPLPLFGEGALLGAVLTLRSDGARSVTQSLLVTNGPRGAGTCSETGIRLNVPAGERFYLGAAALIISTAFGQTFDLCLEPADGITVIRPPSTRPAYLIAGLCAGQCIADCLNAAAAPAAPGKARKQFVDPLGLTTLRRFRDEVLATSAKGRDYAAMYRELSDDAYRALAATPYALKDLARARDAWLPAIGAWVEGTTTTPISQDMLDTLDVLAQHLVTLGSERLAATVRDQYQRLDPPSLLGQTIGDLEARFEQSVPTRGILRSSFEAGEPGN